MKEKTADMSIFEIISNTFTICFENFFDFTKYLAYPVLGQFFGLILALGPALIFKLSGMEPGSLNFVLVFLFTIPGLVLFCHAFWKYLVRSASTNAIALRLIKGEKAENFFAFDEIITKRTNPFIALLCLQLAVSIAVCISILLPYALFFTQNPLIIIAAILLSFIIFVVCIYACYHLVLSTTAFALDENMGAIGAFEKSIQLSHGKIFKTFVFVFIISLVLSALSALFGIPLIGYALILIYFIISPVLTSLALTHWYLRLENEQTNLII